MRPINKRKLFLVMAIWAVLLALLSYWIKQALDVPRDSMWSVFITGIVVGGGLVAGMSLLSKLVASGKFRWMEQQE